MIFKIGIEVMTLSVIRFAILVDKDFPFAIESECTEDMAFLITIISQERHRMSMIVLRVTVVRIKINFQHMSISTYEAQIGFVRIEDLAFDVLSRRNLVEAILHKPVAWFVLAF